MCRLVGCHNNNDGKNDNYNGVDGDQTQVITTFCVKNKFLEDDDTQKIYFE